MRSSTLNLISTSRVIKKLVFTDEYSLLLRILLNRGIQPPPIHEQIAGDNLIRDLKNIGAWNHISHFYIFARNYYDKTFDCMDWKSGAFSATWTTDTGVWDKRLGYRGNGTNTRFQTANFGTTTSFSDAFYMAKCYTNVVEALGCIFGTRSGAGSNLVSMTPLRTSTALRCLYYTNTNINVVVSNDSRGYYTLGGTSTLERQVWRNDSLIYSDNTTGGVAPQSTNLWCDEISGTATNFTARGLSLYVRGTGNLFAHITLMQAAFDKYLNSI